MQRKNSIALSTRKLFIGYLSLFLTNSIYAQEFIEGDTPIPSKKKFVCFELGPQITDIYLSTKNSDSLYQLIIDSRDEIEFPKFSYSGGVSVIFSANRLLSFNTGIVYANKGNKSFNGNLIYIAPDPNAPNDPNLPSSAQFTYHMHYIDIPLLVKLTILGNNLKLFSSFGLVTNVLLFGSTQSKYFFPDGTVSKNHYFDGGSYRRISLSANLGIGISYALNTESTLSAEPFYQYGFTTLSKGEVDGYFRNAAIKFSYIRALRK